MGGYGSEGKADCPNSWLFKSCSIWVCPYVLCKILHPHRLVTMCVDTAWLFVTLQVLVVGVSVSCLLWNHLSASGWGADSDLPFNKVYSSFTHTLSEATVDCCLSLPFKGLPLCAGKASCWFSPKPSTSLSAWYCRSSLASPTSGEHNMGSRTVLF